MNSRGHPFHEHLDVCKQCRDHPFGLCPVGQEALKKTVEDISNDPDLRGDPFLEYAIAMSVREGRS